MPTRAGDCREPLRGRSHYRDRLARQISSLLWTIGPSAEEWLALLPLGPFLSSSQEWLAPSSSLRLKSGWARPLRAPSSSAPSSSAPSSLAPPSAPSSSRPLPKSGWPLPRQEWLAPSSPSSGPFLALGLLDVHSRYGLSARCIAKAIHLSRRLRRFCFLHRRSESYRQERPSCRVGIAPTEDQHLSTAHKSGWPLPPGPFSSPHSLLPTPSSSPQNGWPLPPPSSLRMAGPFLPSSSRRKVRRGLDFFLAT